MSDASDQASGGQGAQAAGNDERRAQRQDRMRRLMGGPAVVQGGAAAAPGATPRQAMMERAVRLLTDTPADAAGMVPGTAFTQAGVGAFLAQLRRRSADQGQPGAKVAARILSFLEPGPDEAEGQVQGVSVKKLQRMAQLTAGALRIASGGARQGLGRQGPGGRRGGGALGRS